jgi:transposase
VREAHSFEVATDNGLLVAATATQESHDHQRLLPLVEAAAKNEPQGVLAVEGDSGYYRGETVAALERAGLETCIPDSNTAGDLHRGLPIGTTQNRTRGKVPFTYDPEEDAYHCPEGNRLTRTQHRRAYGPHVTVYRAEEPCTGCPQRSDCLSRANAQHRTLKVGDDHELLAAARQRFAEPAHQDRYRHRGEQVETVFGFLRATLGFTRWWLRGADKVAAEAKLFKTAYQFRKVHKAWAG